MKAETTIFNKAAEFSQAGEPFMLLTVVQAKGSAPRAAGARMIVRPGPDRPEQIGTIGGGGGEHRAIADALELFAEKGSALKRYDLTPEHGQACGGMMQVFLQYIGSPLRLVIFGAGHVAFELVQVLRDAELAVTIVDERDEWNTQERFPAARRLLSNREGVALAHEEPTSTLVCVMTYSHEVDFAICNELLVKPPAYLGMMGSKRKRESTFARLVEAGHAREVVES
ncbi:MAG: XdhC family protein, partial [Phycisphaerales bacterium JB038]